MLPPPDEQRTPHEPHDGQSSQQEKESTTPLQRQGDRGSTDDDALCLPIYVRFRDLVAANIVGNWPTLLRLIAEEDFPTGIMLSSNRRAWLLSDVQSWLAARPAARTTRTAA